MEEQGTMVSDQNKTRTKFTFSREQNHRWEIQFKDVERRGRSFSASLVISDRKLDVR